MKLTTSNVCALLTIECILKKKKNKTLPNLYSNFSNLARTQL